jgi:tetratricopeptide (TPR) repeat protein
VLLADGRSDEAAADFKRALDISLGLARDAGASRDEQMDLGQSYAWLADAEFLRGRLDPASAYRSAERAIYLRLIERDPDDRAAKLSLAINRTAVARILLSQGLDAQALRELDAAIPALDRLIESAPGDASYKASTAPTLLLLAEALLRRGDLDRADAAAQRALDMSEHAARKDPTVLEWRGLYLGAARTLSIRISAARAASTSRQEAALAPSRAEADRLAALAAASPHRYGLARISAEARMLAGDYASLDHEPDRARNDWTAATDTLTRAGAPSPLNDDPSQALLRQLDYRLQFSYPPPGPITTDNGVTRKSVRARAQSIVDYYW